MANDYKNIPASLCKMNQWVCFKLEWNAAKNKHDKIPYNPVTGYKAKANDSTTWTDYETAAAAVQRGAYDGIGFEFANGIFGVDLDHVVNVDKTLTAEAQDIIKTLDSYTEYSPSGTGAHIICVGSIPPKDRRNGNVEMYSDGRFFTVTGNVLGQPKEVQERTEAAATVHAKYIKREAAPVQPAPQKPNTGTNTSDSSILNKAFNSERGASIRALYSGDTSAYGGDQSRADQALINHLAYWTNGNAEQMDRLFRQSGLIRDKWNERHGADTYGNMTINKALESFTPYTPASGTDYKVSFGTPPSVGTQQLPQEPAESQREYPTSDNPQPDSISEYLERTFTDDLRHFSTFKDKKTGFDNLDKHCGGLYPGLYVIGAISSLGKTTFIHQMGDQLAAAGNHILFFSLEQSRLEMVTKSISRTMARRSISTAVSAINIRSRGITPEVLAAAEEYNETAKNISVIECNFNESIESILKYIHDYMAKNPGIKPVTIVDYLQIIPPSDPRQDIRAKVDNIVRGLKKIQSENDLVIFIVSSINRSNYLYPIDFESFKESGGIEYTADVIWGLQLQVLNDDIFDSDKKIKEKRELVRKAKMAEPRKMELVCLKNRYGISSYKCGFNYYPRFDLFAEDPSYREGESGEAQEPSRSESREQESAKPGKANGKAKGEELIIKDHRVTRKEK